MRESLTVAAALLVLLLTAALVGPYFIDWTGQRTIVEARLSLVVGAPVHVRGKIDLRLLPTPYFTLEDVEAGDQAGALGLSATSMQAELALFPLLRGDIDFVEARLDAPRIAIKLAPDGSFERPPGAPPLARDLRFDRLVVNDGVLTVTDPQTSRVITFAGLDLDAQADSLGGPFKAEGAFAMAGVRTVFRLSTGAVEAGKMRIKLIVGESVASPRIDADGTLAFDAARPSYAGPITLSGPLRLGEAATRWRAAGTWRGDIRQAAAENLDVRLGDDEHGVSAQGAALLSLGPTPQLAAQLHTRQVDLDRVLAADGQPPPLVRAETALRQILENTVAFTPGVSLAFTWTGETLLLGGEPLNDVTLGLDLAVDRPPFVRIDTSVPGGGRLKLDGAVETGSAAAFNGQLDAALPDLERLSAWAGPILPAGGPTPPFKAMTASGQVSLSGVGFSGRDLVLGFDRSALRGALAFTRAVGNEPARLFADLQASALDLRSVPDTSSLRGAARDVDLEIRLAANGVRFDRPGQPAIEAGRVRLDLQKAKDVVRLRDLAVEGFDGGSLSAHGTMDGAHVVLDGKVDATRLDAAGALLKRLVPSPAAAIFAARAGALAPLNLVWSAKADISDGATPFRVTDLTLAGSAASTRLSGQIRPASVGTQASLQVEAPDTVGLLRQIGLPVLAIRGSGPARITFDGQGRLDEPFVTTGSATLAGTAFTWSGQIDPGAATFGGTVRLASDDLTPLLQASTIALPDLTQRIPVALSGAFAWNRGGIKIDAFTGTLNGTALRGGLEAKRGDGPTQVSGTLETDRIALGTIAALALGTPQAASPGDLWSKAPFGASLAEPPAANLAFKAHILDLPGGSQAQDADLRLEIGPGLVRLRDLKAALGTGRIGGMLDLRRDGAQAAVEGHLTATDVALAFSCADGRATFDLGFAGTGTTPDALAASLGGSGHLQLTNLTLARVDPRAVGQTATAIDEEQIGLDPAEVTRTLRRALDVGALPMGTRDFELGLAGGMLRLTPSRDATGPPLAATINVRSGTLDARLDLVARDLPSAWHGPLPTVALLFKGPLPGPVMTPTIEIGDFLNVMAERAIARDSARIQAFEFDAHERAVANARLAYERRREAERQKAEDEARRAAEKRAFDEEMRRAAAMERARVPREDGPEPVRRPSAIEAPVRPSAGPPPDPAVGGPY